VLALIERKASGEEVHAEPLPAAPGPRTPDLMAALERSLEEAQARAGEATKAGKPARAKPRAKAPAANTARKPTRAKSR